MRGATASTQARALSEHRIFFGHQSVGADILQGVAEEGRRQGEPPVRVIETSDPARMDAAGLYHARIGRNGSPESKLADFASLVVDAAPTVAMMKFCYVDIAPATDPHSLFSAYETMVERVRAERPGVTLVHVTTPLTSDRGGWLHLKTRIRGNGGSSDRRLNLVRHEYNELLRTTYAGRAPVFDLANLESTDVGGRPVTVRFDRAAVPVLSREWTTDGGHLNEAGRRRAAVALLQILSAL